MPFFIVRNDIACMTADAIVNTANPLPQVGWGTDSRIHQAAGPELLEARKKIGSIAVGSAAITPAFRLPARFVIHTVGPVWQDGTQGEEALLHACYTNSLRLALEAGCRSVAFPLISTGNYGFPKDRALRIALSAFNSFLLEQEMDISLVVFDRTAFQLSEKLFSHVASFIDENYVEALQAPPPGVERNRPPRPRRTEILFRSFESRAAQTEERCVLPEAPCPAPSMAPRAMSLEDMLRQEDAGFTETLLRLIDRTGKKDSQIYKKANLSKQHFSKIRNNPHYRPTKATALALAVALELDLDETRDLIGRAGYALTNSSKFDLIIRYFIQQGNYNIMEINLALFEHDQLLLGA